MADVKITEAEKKAECLRICGPNIHPSFHKMAPEMCPIKLDEWKHPKRKKEY